MEGGGRTPVAVSQLEAGAGMSPLIGKQPATGTSRCPFSPRWPDAYSVQGCTPGAPGAETVSEIFADGFGNGLHWPSCKSRLERQPRTSGFLVRTGILDLPASLGDLASLVEDASCGTSKRKVLIGIQPAALQPLASRGGLHDVVAAVLLYAH
jgi:hypothetical protein